MKSHNTKWLFAIVLIGAVAFGFYALSRSQQNTLADPIVRLPAAPAGASSFSASTQNEAGEAIHPVVVNLKDIPPGVYDPDNMYERWLRGEIDLRENESRQGEQFVKDKIAEALSLPVSEAVQLATSGAGLEAPTPGIGFDSLDYNECCGGGGSVPPDPEMTAGPNHLIAVVNVSFEIYDKAGNTLVAPTTLDSLLGSAGGGCTATFDPNAVYDEEADRYIIAADGDGTDYCIAVSQTNDPTGSYNVYRVPAQPVGGEFHDYPHTGVGDSYIVVGANQFGGSIPNGFEGRIWALDKSVMYAGGVLTPVTASVGYDGGTPQPLNLHGFNQGTWPSFGSTHYIATDFYDGCQLDIWQWNIPSAPTIVATFDLCTATGVTGGMPVDYPQSGGSPIQANDWRMRGFEYRNGSGWIADSISCNPGGGTVDCARWTEVDLNGGSPTLAQAGVYASTGEYRTFPDLAVNQCNDMAIGYTKSSTSMFPSVWYSGRESGDPAGTLQAEAELKAGEIAYIAFDGTPYRWGDYTGMTIDPDGTTFWYLGQYSKNTGTTSGRWGTYIGSFSYPSCGGASNPQVELTKTVGTDPATCAVTDAITVNEGTDVTYCYSIENTGDVTFTLHTLTDSELGDILVDFPYQLVPGASAFITATATITTTTTNTAVWTASDPSGPVSAADSDTATVTVPPAEIGVDASGLGNTQAISNVVTYTLTINNTGGSSLSWMIEEDPLAAQLASPIMPLPPVGSTAARGESSDNTAPINYDSPADFSEGFDDITNLPGWFSQNNSSPLGTTNWFQGNETVFPAQAGAPTAYIGANFNNTSGVGTISNWLLTPELTLSNGDTFSFWTRTAAGSIWPDRLQVRLSTAGASTNVGTGAEDVGDFTTLLLDINPTLSAGGYPEAWTQYTITVSGLSGTTSGRFAFRYYVTNGGPSGSNSNYIGIDTVEYVSNMVVVCSAPSDIPWVSVSPTSGNTDAGDSSAIDVTYDTNGLMVGTTYTGTLCVSSNDPVTPLVTVPLTLTVEAPSYGVALSPAQALSGDAGTTVVYTVTITNTGNTVDTFDLTTAGAWAVTLSQATITLDSGEAGTFTVEVTIPGDVSDGDTDVTTVTATSQNDATATAESELTTTAIVEGYSVFLPIIVR